MRRFADEVRAGSGFAVLSTLLDLIVRDDPDGGRMLTAGWLLARHPPAGADEVSIAITGSGTTSSLVPLLTAELARHSLWARYVATDVGRYQQDLRAPASGAEFTLCVLDADLLFDELLAPWTADDVEHAATAKLAELRALAAARAGGVLVLNTVAVQRRHIHQIIDFPSRARTAAAVHSFNAEVLRLGADLPGVVVIDLAPLVASGGPLADTRLAQYAGTKLGDEVLARYARDVGHVIRAHRGRSKKVLVLDLDHTLWDGVLGDDGPAGLAAAGTLRGEAFRAFQRQIRQLASQGVLLAVCSKNDEDAVTAVLREHPDMTLRATDFAVVKANWQRKDLNLLAIATQLNLGLDSLVHVDDSAFETGLVSTTLPEIRVLLLDDEPATHGERLLADGWFDTAGTTAEDRHRSSWYRDDAARRALLATSGSLDDFLAELGTTVHIGHGTEQDVARVAQLTQRTNQFNLTTHRLDAPDVRNRLQRSGELVLTIRATDRFGDNGLVGAIFARRTEDTVSIENMVLSCRVFGRGIEHAAVRTLLEHARAAGTTSVHGIFRPSAKNTRFANFYRELGFAQVSDAPATFTHSLDVLPAPAPHVTLHCTLEGTHDAQ